MPPAVYAEPVSEIEIGLGKSARRGYSFDELAIVPSRRTRDPEVVDISWQIDAYRFDLPVLSSPTDGVTSPATAAEIGRLGGLGVLNLEGLWTRYEDPNRYLTEIDSLDDDKVVARIRQLYEEPVKDELIKARIAELRAAGATTAGAVTPQRAQSLIGAIAKADLDLLVIQGTIVSAEHVGTEGAEPLNLKTFIRSLDLPVIVGGCASYPAALHLMRTGAAGVLVGVGAGHASTTRGVLGVGVPMATAIADVRAARIRHLDETGVYCHLIADGSLATSGDIAKAVACGADAVMLGSALAAAREAPAAGSNWGNTATHGRLPRSVRVRVEPRGTLEEILLGPTHDTDGRLNLFGALRKTMALCGYQSLKEFQKADLVVAPGGRTEGKALQLAQSVGLGR
jgi:IMP dehydrogenase